MRRKRKTAFQQFMIQQHYSGTDELFGIEQGLQGYNLDLVRKLAKGLKTQDFRDVNYSVLDFGAGTGTLAEVWQKEIGVTPVCIEIDPQLIQVLRAKGFKTYSEFDEIIVRPNLIYTSNVLEHIENDIEALKELRDVISPGGSFGIYVPALPFLFSDLDRKVGHFRRYRKNELVDKVSAAGFIVDACFYNDSLGVLAALLVKLLGFKSAAGLGSRKSFIFYDRFIYPVSRILDQILLSKIVGKNLFLFAHTNDFEINKKERF